MKKSASDNNLSLSSSMMTQMEIVLNNNEDGGGLKDQDSIKPLIEMQVYNHLSQT